MGRRFFISHVTAADGAAARELADRLAAEGVSAWLAPRDIPAGAPYSEAITDALEACDAIVVLLSPATAGSAAVAKEVEIGVGRLGKPVYLVRLAKIEPPKSIAFHVSTFQWVDAFGSLDDAARVIARGGSVRRNTNYSSRTRSRTPWAAIGAAGAATLAALTLIALLLGRDPSETSTATSPSSQWTPQQQTVSGSRTQPETSLQRSDPPFEAAARAPPENIQPSDRAPASSEPSRRAEPEPERSSTLDFTEEPTR